MPVLTEARDKAAPYVADARDKAAPYVSDARDRFSETVLPVLTAALASVDEATEDVRDETRKRGKAVAAALKGEIEAPRKKRRGRKLLVLLGLESLRGRIEAAAAISHHRNPDRTCHGRTSGRELRSVVRWDHVAVAAAVAAVDMMIGHRHRHRHRHRRTAHRH